MNRAPAPSRHVYLPYQAGLHGRITDWWFRTTGSPSFDRILYATVQAGIVSSWVLGVAALVIAGIGH